MKKAILELKAPESCMRCDLMVEGYNEWEADMCCVPNRLPKDVSIYTNKRAPFCPLKIEWPGESTEAKRLRYALDKIHRTMTMPEAEGETFGTCLADGMMQIRARDALRRLVLIKRELRALGYEVPNG